MDWKSEQINELADALAKAQGEIKGAKKSSDNPFFKSKYAELSEVIDAYREPFAKNGLSLTQFPFSDGDRVGLRSILLHKSGQWMSLEPLSWTPAKKDIQGAGSLITYMRRYVAAAVSGVAQIDDDGNEASEQESHPPTKQHRGGSQSEYAPVNGLPLYPGSEIAKNKMQWEALIKGKQRSPEDIINAIKSSYSLSPAQETTIKSLGRGR